MKKTTKIILSLSTLVILIAGYEYLVRLWSDYQTGAIIRADIFIIYPLLILASILFYYLLGKIKSKQKLFVYITWALIAVVLIWLSQSSLIKTSGNTTPLIKENIERINNSKNTDKEKEDIEINLALINFLKKNYSKEEIPKLSNYVIKEIDLDKNPVEKEYIVLAVSGMEECGSGGCNMYIVNRMGTSLGKTTIVNTPVYIEKDKKFPALIVWSDEKYRKLIFDGEKYSSNASLAEEVNENEIKNSQKY